MKIDYKVLSGVLLVVCYASSMSALKHRIAFEKMSEFSTFLSSKLDDNNIPLTEFDRIALETIVS